MKLQQAIRIVIVVTLCLWTASAQSPAQTRLSEARRNFDQFYQESLAKSGIVGSSFMLLCDNQVIDRQFYGLSNLEQKIPTDEDTIYHWASITKTFTGIAIMQLRDRGLLSLDDPIIKYVPNCALSIIPSARWNRSRFVT